jgi:hypothetical protein
LLQKFKILCGLSGDACAKLGIWTETLFPYLLSEGEFLICLEYCLSVLQCMVFVSLVVECCTLLIYIYR